MVQFLLMTGIVAIVMSGIMLENWTDGRYDQGSSQAKSIEATTMRKQVGIYIGLTGLLAIGVSAVMYFF